MSTKGSVANADSFYKARVWGMVLNATLGMFQFGYILSILNTLMAYFEKDVYHFSEDDKAKYAGILNAACTVGAAVGALVAGPIAKKLGRRTSMIAVDVIVIIASVLTLIENINVFILGRVIGGFCVGFNSTLVPLYMNEITPLSIKGVAGAFNQIQICLGSFLAVLFGFGLPEADFSGFQGQWWRIMLGFPILVAAIRLSLVFLVFTTETPKFLVYNDRKEEARDVLGTMYKPEYISEQLMILEQTREEDERAGKVTFVELFGPRFRLRLMIGMFIAFLQQMTGVNAFIFYSTDIFRKAAGDDTAVTLSVILNALNLLATLVSGQIINRFGRKTILIVGDVLITGTIIVTAILFMYDAKTALIFPIFLFIILFGLTYGPVPWIFIAEILPDIGIGVAVLTNWTGGFLIALGYPLLADPHVIGTGPTFLIFGVFDVLALFVLIFVVKETFGLTSAQINDVYSGKVGDSSPKRNEISLQGEYEKMYDS
mmetsp:Transcript_12290/g.14115  ORF Transcript_12290/g.14115 Transcript_12290/m.14115 type:complete len:487 (-) Transcript_12290:244-1704(-)|eukprot:CAMPEP_0176419970 /NCGR_PEP_ID=MMETSP0127-20121128/8349_1 /TAXON_ID=938130 /ORGANISM="Platyophrya macrostoma, Strain WH" /LENGTH=486 /DNA_ID=CAMNT_0017800519 /DNA_START=31 /DNA_END=1491 /DNA_ORIENTATION=-